MHSEIRSIMYALEARLVCNLSADVSAARLGSVDCPYSYLEGKKAVVLCPSTSPRLPLSDSPKLLPHGPLVCRRQYMPLGEDAELGRTLLSPRGGRSGRGGVGGESLLPDEDLDKHTLAPSGAPERCALISLEATRLPCRQGWRPCCCCVLC